MRVFINPGHDRRVDPGACGYCLEEADVVWDVGTLLKDYLTQAGVEVSDILQDDDLWYVCNQANNSESDIFVSIHCNSAMSDAAHGTETFCYGRGTKGELLAGCIQKQIVDALETTDRGIKIANFYVLKRTDMPAVLVELAFINNWDDNQLLRYKQDEFARAIARGITDYQHLLEANNE